MPYQHPGQLFIAQQGPLQREADVERYGNFLRRVAGLNEEPPVDLQAIYRRFEMPLPQLAPLMDQQGILVDGDRGLILIKADDPTVRQRFTAGHELMELLFEAQAQQATGWQVRGDRKEQLCDRGAAMLLMPRTSFGSRLTNLGVSITTAKALAQDYRTSLLATLVRMMQLAAGAHCLLVWRLGWDTDAEQRAGKEPPRLRLWWRSPSAAWQAPLPGAHVAVEEDSVVAIAERLDQFLTGTELWPVAELAGQEGGDVQGGAQSKNQRENQGKALGTLNCSVEALPLKIGRRRCVVALFHAL